MNVKRILLAIGGVAMLALVWTVVNRMLPKGEQEVGLPQAVPSERKVAGSSDFADKAARDVPRATKPPRFPRAGDPARPSTKNERGEIAPVRITGSQGGGQAAAKTESEKAVEVWDAFVEKVAERTEVPTVEEATRFKEEFRKLDAADRMDGIQNALNLLPDGQFSLVYPILFDKTESADILDEIFSDALNRDEEIKVPIMKEIYKDKEHPMFVEAARILDATGELDEMNGADETVEEEDAVE